MFARFTRSIMLGCALLALPLAAAHAQQTFTGNGGAGFGGAVGGGSLTLSFVQSTGTINGSFTPGTNFSGNALVLYLSTGAAGVSNTSTFTDTADGGRSAISGFHPTNTDAGNADTRTLVNFASGFQAAYAITIEPDVFSGLFNLSTPTNFGYINSNNLQGTGNGPFTFSFALSDIGISNPNVSHNIDFVGSLISTSAYRSNETIGASTTVPGDVQRDATNAGYNGTQTFTSFNRFTTIAAVVPEANTVALLGVGVLPLAGIALRRRKK